MRVDNMGRRSAAPTSQQADSGYFKGDDDLMVDRLVAACSAQKKALPELLPGYGRDLTPYFYPGSEGSEQDINMDFASDTTASSPPSPQSLSFVPMTKTTPSQVQLPAPHAKRGRKSRKKLEYGTRASDSDSGSDSAGCRHAQSKSKKTVEEPCFTKGLSVQPPSDFLILAASTVSEEQRQRVAQAFAQAANATNKPAKVSMKPDRCGSDIMTNAASTVSEEQRRQVAQAFALSAAASRRGSQKQVQEKQLQQRLSHNTRSSPSSGASSRKWAGGAFANVPDPTNIPLPSMLLHATSTPSSSTASLPGLQDQDVSINQHPSSLNGPVNPIKSSQMLAMLDSNGTGLQMPSHCGQTTLTPDSIVDAAASQALRQLLNF